MVNYLERYLGGEHEPVWAELTALGARVREDPYIADALAVARETMRRARQNIERLITRLDDIGYQFRAARAVEFERLPDINPFTKRSMARHSLRVRRPMVFRPPGPNIREQVDRIEMAVGGLPLSLRAWFEIVGEVDMTGSHPDWPTASQPSIYPDPLVMVSAEDFLTRFKRDVEYRERYGTDPGPWSVDVGDFYMKQEVSGACYVIELPDLAADALFHGAWHDHALESTTPPGNTFVHYLRTCFRWGGFPGFALTEKRPARDLAYLTADLLAL